MREVEADEPSLRERYGEELEFAAEDDEFLGDDTVYDLRLAEDVPVFGAAHGDRLSYDCFCDGAPVVYRYARAAGLELSWESVPDIEARTDADLEVALGSAGTVSRAGG